jgi:hypothetical protein
VGEGELKPLDEGMDDDKEQLRIVNLVCDAVDHEGGLSFFPSPRSSIGCDRQELYIHDESRVIDAVVVCL